MNNMFLVNFFLVWIQLWFDKDWSAIHTGIVCKTDAEQIQTKKKNRRETLVAIKSAQKLIEICTNLIYLIRERSNAKMANIFLKLSQIVIVAKCVLVWF